MAVIGLGYVGLPLAVALARHFPVVGFDIDADRVAALAAGHDATREVTAEELAAVPLRVTADPAALADVTFFVVTVPTPVDDHKQPVFTPLIRASETVGAVLKRGDIVVYESTVYPGATEEVCVPVLERTSGLALGRDFGVGYSPERANPGDRAHKLSGIVKVTSGSSPAVADLVDAVYGRIVGAGTHRAPSIRVAEAAKVIENTQRDLNIALVNELAVIFNRMGLDTQAVLDAAATKWNFLDFRPGLVGGHCIGVDPYYLTYKAEALGHHPEVILAGRRINDGMGRHVVAEVVKLMVRRRLHVAGARVLVLGFAFKENCPDARNTRVIDVVEEFRTYGAEVAVHDPWVDPADVKRTYGLDLVAQPQAGSYDAIVLAVAHREYRAWGADAIRAFGHGDAVVYDVKSVLPADAVDGRL
ncbi:nucleotide sugar dehydrogenase [Zavarzinia sp. CC-PAN008]|uniref:nucleotide sugar dehydrogenase n=1 Tax=Zavarzinia sp. CC-PAN008 TaxID=3243332 RepID=UPI003F745B24